MMVPVTGSSWIDQGPDGSWMDYGSYSLFYQAQGATVWTPLVKDSAQEIRNNTFATWNTYGLATGNYVLKLVVKNNLGDSVEALKNVTLLPSILGINNTLSTEMFRVYPNPAGNKLLINSSEKVESIEIYSMLGERTASATIPLQKGEESAIFDISSL